MNRRRVFRSSRAGTPALGRCPIRQTPLSEMDERPVPVYSLFLRHKLMVLGHRILVAHPVLGALPVREGVTLPHGSYLDFYDRAGGVLLRQAF